jgi:hypothetical protein
LDPGPYLLHSAIVVGASRREEYVMADEEKATTTEAPVPAVPAERGDWFDRWFTDWPRFRFLPELRRSFAEGMEPLRVEEFTVATRWWCAPRCRASTPRRTSTSP